MEEDGIKKIFIYAIRLIAGILLFINLLNTWMMFWTRSSRAEKKLERYLEKTYGEEFYIGHFGKRRINKDKVWYEAGIIFPKSYLGTYKQNDEYYWGTGFVEIKGIYLDPGDNFGAVVLNEGASEFFLPKLKELFGDNVYTVFDVQGYYEKRNFIEEMERRKEAFEKYAITNGNPTIGKIFIFGRVKDEKDKEWYRKQIFEFVKFYKESGYFNFVTLHINVIDERILALNSYDYIKNLKRTGNVNEDLKVLDEPFKNTTKETIEYELEEGLSKSNIYEIMNNYGAYLLTTTVTSPKRLMANTEKQPINKYEKVNDILFEGEKLEVKDGVVRESSTDEKYYMTEYKSKERNGVSKQYDSTGKIVLWEGSYKDDKLEGLFKEYYEDGSLKSEGVYKNDKLEGEVKNYYENGNIKSKIIYKNGLEEGKALYYYNKSEVILEKEKMYKGGKLNGKSKEYYSDGTLAKETEYKNDEKDGIEKEYNFDGVCERMTTFKAGFKNGIEKIYTSDGELIEESNYQNGRLHGDVKKYYESKKLKFYGVYKEGREIRKEEYYYNGKIKEMYDYDKRIRKIYSENGILVSETIYDKTKDFKWIEKEYREDDGTLHYIHYFEYHKPALPSQEFDRDGKEITRKTPGVIKFLENFEGNN